MNKQMILVRHAHRDTTGGRQQDNGLSEKGRRQAEEVSDYWSPRLRDRNTMIISSPKARCTETVHPLSESIKRDIQVDSRLDEQGEAESDEMYLNRVKEVVEWCKTLPADMLVLCSHGDWIPDCIELVTREDRHVKKGSWETVHVAG